ncbi:Thiolase [Ophiocordyceps sinensis CO18]|uniref:Thiolase n=1 Tax=Ophiocordyceps sinensis (strain Co18 / CGMCC 3.14243) TaxID=911162 RepID=T5A6K6_OPHSC|nr:Thiolase [Ophiocordyceps sinensis CO18]
MAGQKSPVYVLGVGMTKFIKPRGKVDYTELGFEAGVKALLDAHITYDDVDQAVACYCYGDSTCGQRVFYQFGMTKIPVYNVNNNCSTGSTGLAMARSLVATGAAHCVMVVGFEKMMAGSLQSHFDDRENPTGTTVAIMAETRGVENAPGAAQLFGNAGREYMERHGATADDFAEIARVNHSHSPNNPYSQFRQVYSLDQIKAAPTIFAPLTKLQCCPTSDGGAAAILCAELVWHLRGWANNRAVPGTRHCLQHNLGLGGAVVVTVYRREDGVEAPVVDSESVGRQNRLGYNPAVEAKGFTAEQANSVRSQRAASDWALQDTLEKVLANF